MAICRICGQKVKRSQGANVGTTALRQHMQLYHRVAWENRGSDVVVQLAAATAASPSGTQVNSGSQDSTTSAEGSCLSFLSSVGPDAPAPHPTPPCQSFRQQSITKEIAKGQQYAALIQLRRS